MDAGSAVIEADAMQHSYEMEDNGKGKSVRDYVTKKRALYIEAGERNEDLIIRRLHRGLDPMLASAVHLRTDRPNTFEHFTREVYTQDPVARAAYDNQQKKIQDATKKQEEETKKRELSMITQRSRQQEPQPRFIPRDAARVIGQRFAQETRYPYGQRYQSPNAPYNPRYASQSPSPASSTAPAPAPRALPAPAPAPAPAQRPPFTPYKPYPCTTCGSKDHIDPHCPIRPDNRFRRPAQAPVHYADADDAVEVSEDAFQEWLHVSAYMAHYDNSDSMESLISLEDGTSGNDHSGSSGESHR